MKSLALLVLIVGSLLGVGCSQSDSDKAQRTVEDAAQGAADVSSRAAMTAKVKSAFASSNKVDAGRIDVDTTDKNEIFLWGFVSTQEEKDTATRLAQDIAGEGYTVQNKLELRPKAD